MLSANSLLNKGNPKVAPNVRTELRDPMYNPSTPTIGDDNTKFVKDARSLRMKDRFYVDMTLNSYSKNGDGYTLGQNNKGFKAFLDYDRAIDPNLLIRRDPNSKQYYQPNDFYNGSYDAYYSLPKSIKRPNPTIGGDLLSEIAALYQFKPASISTGFLNNIASGAINTPVSSSATNAVDAGTATTSLSIPVPSPTRSPGVTSYASRQDMATPTNTAPVMETDAPIRTPTRMNDINTIGTDPTEDPDIINAKDEYDKMMKESRLAADKGSKDREFDTVYKRYHMDDKLDQYGNPAIRTGTRIKLSGDGNFKSYGI